MDRWLVKKIAQFIFFRYRGVLHPELGKWLDLAEQDRLHRLASRVNGAHHLILQPGARILSPENLTCGAHVAVGHYSILRAQGGITLGDYVVIGDSVILASAGHPVGELYFDNTWQAPIRLDANVWVGANALILPGTHIGENSVIGAGAVVTGDIPPNSVAVGVPARVVKQFQPDPATLAAQRARIEAHWPPDPAR